MFRSIMSPVVYVRACIYYEAYRVVGHQGKAGHLLATLLVAALDAPFLRAASNALVKNMPVEGAALGHIPATITSAGEVVGLAAVAVVVLGVFLLEHVYYRYIDDGQAIVRRFERMPSEDLRWPHAVALCYAFIMLVGGTIAVVLFR